MERREELERERVEKDRMLHQELVKLRQPQVNQSYVILQKGLKGIVQRILSGVDNMLK
jgi:hypothetical protein